MSRIGTSVTQSIAGAVQAEQAASRDKARKTATSKPSRRVEDSVELKVPDTEGPEAARRLRGNSDEETAQDRREHPGYAKPNKPVKPAAKRIDLEG
ncbi:MAG: hypothetical protein ACT4PL_10635 [Phycisphaerales bacterium]